MPTCVSPSAGIASSSIWHHFNYPRSSYVVSPTLYDRYSICVTFRTIHDSLSKSIRFWDFSEDTAERTICFKYRKLYYILFSFSLESYRLCWLLHNFFWKKKINKCFPIRHKNITQRRLHQPWITSDIMKCIRKKIIDGSGLLDVVS